MKNQMDHSFIALNKKYPGDVIRADSSADGTFVDLSNKYDIFFLMNPYSAMTHRFYTFAYLARKGQLIVYTHYAVGEGTANSKHFDQLKEMQYLWRFYLERPSEYIRFKKSQPILSLFHRLSVVGAVKTDLLGCQKVQTRNRNRIILAPHHSVPKNNTPLSIGNFNRYASFFLNLPERYPNIDWVFRPHPLLFWTMINLGYWTTSDAENYMKKMMSYSNVEYQTSSEYHEAFVNSDALIQDSGSFIAEYHLTGHPQCYLLRDDKILETQFNTFGRKMLKHTYKAYSENQITHFIDTVVVKGQDNMISSRMDFVEKELKVNFLHASEAIIKDIKNELLNSHEA
jgi:protein-tyrosine phosphatase